MKERFVSLEMAVVAVISLTIAAVSIVSGATLVGGTQSDSNVQEEAASSQEVVPATTTPSIPVATVEVPTTDPVAPQASKAPGNFSPIIIIVPEPTPNETTTTTLNMADYCQMPDLVGLQTQFAGDIGVYHMLLTGVMGEACQWGSDGWPQLASICADQGMESVISSSANINHFEAASRFVSQSPQPGTPIRRFTPTSAFQVSVHVWDTRWLTYPESMSYPRC